MTIDPLFWPIFYGALAADALAVLTAYVIHNYHYDGSIRGTATKLLSELVNLALRVGMLYFALGVFVFVFFVVKVWIAGVLHLEFD